MNKLIYILNIFLFSSIMIVPFINIQTAGAQVIKTDSMNRDQQLKRLYQKRSSLEYKLKMEEKKRGVVLSGVSADAQEKINLSQDSLCLEIRSELVVVNSRINELMPDLSSEQLSHISNMLHEQQNNDSITTSPQRKPSKK